MSNFYDYIYHLYIVLFLRLDIYTLAVHPFLLFLSANMWTVSRYWIPTGSNLSTLFMVCLDCTMTSSLLSLSVMMHLLSRGCL
ncbi:hypothetical protein B0T21DRAFT_147218 [Apiosordaria backusii]|uniref:Uncharacterized protein n=1 Tax=Apiosordaria backusii TaxID=314023 RepID=A0AA40EGZ8_9PEZI|nr:hypothetical protein B0T21DRAFT_147218 [Apiosordaria backusii]